MASNSNNKRDQPLVSYQVSEDIDKLERLDNAFDILFEETLKSGKNLDLTTNDN